MDIVMNVVNFVKDHGEEMLAGLGGLYAFLLVVAHLTPTPKDDEALGKVHDLVLKVLAFFKVKK